METLRLPKRKPTNHGTRERRDCVHIATFTRTALEAITNEAKALGISRNEAIQQACSEWISKREKVGGDRVRFSLCLEAKTKAKIDKIARMNNQTTADYLAFICHSVINAGTHYPDYHHERKARRKEKVAEEVTQ